MTKSSDNNKLLVSVIVPCRNEERFLPAFLESLMAQSLPKEHFEVIVLDGMSEDRSREILQAFAKRFPHFYIEDNEALYVPQALNKGIRMARAPFIARLDVHTLYPPDYLEKLLYWQQKTQADNIGGLCETLPRSKAVKALAIAQALSHPLGVGNSSFRTGAKQVQEADTVPFGFFPKSTFEKFGLFDERLIRNQDIELNKRILRAGGKIVLVPEIRSHYFARDSLRKLWQNMFSTGEWVIRAVQLTGHWDALSLRHFIPMLFITYLFTLPMAAFWGLTATPIAGFSPVMLAGIYMLPLGVYLIALLGVGASIAVKQKKPMFFFWIPLILALIHLAYGLGSWKGILYSSANGFRG